MGMNFFYLLIFLFLFSCVTSEKQAYDSVQSKSKTRSADRNIAYLQDIAQSEEDSFKFVAKQMKNVIRNYKRMKDQLVIIENKLDITLEKLNSYKMSLASQNELTTSITDEIIIINKSNEEIIISINETEDYKNIMGQILAGDFDIDLSEEQRLIALLKSKLKKTKTELENNVKELKQEETDSINEDSLLENNVKELKQEEANSFNEDSLLENNLKDSTDIFLLDDKNTKQKEDTSSFLSAKNLFKKQSYETAISEFQKYRNDHPEGHRYPEATFYIGQSFDKLKMPIEADVFFNEIVKSYPQSLWARRAKNKLEK